MSEAPPPAVATAAPAATPQKIHLHRELAYARPLLACRVDPRGRFAVSGGMSNTLQRFDLASGQMIELAAHDSWVRAMAFAADGELLISGAGDGRLIWWPISAEKPEPVRTVEAHAGWVRAVCLSPDGKLLASCGNDNLVKLWSMTDGSPVRTLSGHQRHVYNVAFHPSGASLVSADLMGVVRQWDVASGSELKQYSAALLHGYDKSFQADIGGTRAMAVSPDGKYFACAGISEVSNAFAGQGKPLALLFEWDKPEPVQKFTLKENFVGTGRGLVFHRDGYLVAAFGGHGGGSLAFFRPDAANEFFAFKLPTQCHDLAMSADGLDLAVAFNDKKLRIFRMAEKPAG